MSDRDTRSETADDATADTEPDFTERIHWQKGIVAGAVATVAMGLVIMVTDLELLRAVIAGLYGQEGNLVVGWIAHLVHGSLFGLLFAVILSDPTLARIQQRVWKTVVTGVVYGLILTVVGAGIIMPIWLEFVGFPERPPIPNVTTASLIWHVVYGIVLGAVFSLLTE